MLRNINIAVFEHVKKTAEFVKAYGKGIELTKNGCQMVKGRLGGWGRGQRFCHKMMRLNPIHVGIVFVCTTPGQKGRKKKCSVVLHWLLTVLKLILIYYYILILMSDRPIYKEPPWRRSRSFFKRFSWSAEAFSSRLVQSSCTFLQTQIAKRI